MLRKVPVDELRFFCTAVRMQQKVGGNLAEILDTISGIVRDRFVVMGQVKALTGEGRISGAVLMILPLAAFGGLYSMRPDYLDPLFSDPLGQKMLWGAAALQLVGAFAIKRIVSIKI
jgi:tight adherence protein B